MELIVYNIRRIMKEKGLKQRFVAEKSDFTEQEFSNMMNGRKRVDVEYIPRICFALNVQPNDLFVLPDAEKAAS